jgi:hypothetical protein
VWHRAKNRDVAHCDFGFSPQRTRTPDPSRYIPLICCGSDGFLDDFGIYLLISCIDAVNLTQQVRTPFVPKYLSFALPKKQL